MTFDQLTPDEIAVLAALDAAMRAAAIEVTRTCETLQRLLDFAAAGASDILGKLDRGTDLPTVTGLAGAVPLTIESYVGTLADFQSVIDAHFAAPNRMALRRWIGVNAE